MERRDVLAGACTFAVGASAGCLDASGGTTRTDDDELDVDGDEPTVEAGASATVLVRTTGIQRFQFTAYCHETPGVALHLNDATLDPGPTAGVMDSYPQIWTWERRCDVTVSVPVDVAADETPGRCEYAVAVSALDGEETLERRFEIEVVSPSHDAQ
ncbi:hypothetical protein [Halorubellus salinus]|uniref:hypothetical protein n=1 Tax=Halorubellus salinus TaxID=755309 RepID=UPI001D0782FA|nr:hypothetical protein [Halorubellus salinus]